MFVLRLLHLSTWEKHPLPICIFMKSSSLPYQDSLQILCWAQKLFSNVYFLYLENSIKSQHRPLFSKKIEPLLTSHLLCFLPGDFAEGRPTNCWSQHKYGASSLSDLSNNPWSVNTRRNFLRLKTELRCWREKCFFALEGQTVPWPQRGGRWVPSKPPSFLSVAHCSSSLATSWAELLASYGQWLQCLYVAESGRVRREGWGQRQRWDTDPSPRFICE